MITFLGFIVNMIVGLTIGIVMAECKIEDGWSNKRIGFTGFLLWLSFSVAYFASVYYLKNIGVS